MTNASNDSDRIFELRDYESAFRELDDAIAVSAMERIASIFNLLRLDLSTDKQSSRFLELLLDRVSSQTFPQSASRTLVYLQGAFNIVEELEPAIQVLPVLQELLKHARATYTHRTQVATEANQLVRMLQTEIDTPSQLQLFSLMGDYLVIQLSALEKIQSKREEEDVIIEEFCSWLRTSAKKGYFQIAQKKLDRLHHSSVLTTNEKVQETLAYWEEETTNGQDYKNLLKRYIHNSKLVKNPTTALLQLVQDAETIPLRFWDQELYPEVLSLVLEYYELANFKSTQAAKERDIVLFLTKHVKLSPHRFSNLAEKLTKVCANRTQINDHSPAYLELLASAYKIPELRTAFLKPYEEFRSSNQAEEDLKNRLSQMEKLLVRNLDPNEFSEGTIQGLLAEIMWLGSQLCQDQCLATRSLLEIILRSSLISNELRQSLTQQLFETLRNCKDASHACETLEKLWKTIKERATGWFGMDRELLLPLWTISERMPAPADGHSTDFWTYLYSFLFEKPATYVDRKSLLVELIRIREQSRGAHSAKLLPLVTALASLSKNPEARAQLSRIDDIEEEDFIKGEPDTGNLALFFLAQSRRRLHRRDVDKAHEKWTNAIDILNSLNETERKKVSPEAFELLSVILEELIRASHFDECQDLIDQCWSFDEIKASEFIEKLRTRLLETRRNSEYVALMSRFEIQGPFDRITQVRWRIDLSDAFLFLGNFSMSKEWFNKATLRLSSEQILVTRLIRRRNRLLTEKGFKLPEQPLTPHFFCALMAFDTIKCAPRITIRSIDSTEIFFGLRTTKGTSVQFCARQLKNDEDDRSVQFEFCSLDTATTKVIQPIESVSAKRLLESELTNIVPSVRGDFSIYPNHRSFTDGDNIDLLSEWLSNLKCAQIRVFLQDPLFPGASDAFIIQQSRNFTKAEDCQFWYSGTRNIFLKGENVATVYAPNANVFLNGELTGAIVAKNITLEKNSKIVFDKSLIGREFSKVY